MQARQLTISQKDQIQGVFFDEVTFFDCVQDINDNWFIILSESDISNITDTQWQWVIDLPLSTFNPKPITPPT
jgi:hypothetical protein